MATPLKPGETMFGHIKHCVKVDWDDKTGSEKCMILLHQTSDAVVALIASCVAFVSFVTIIVLGSITGDKDLSFRIMFAAIRIIPIQCFLYVYSGVTRQDPLRDLQSRFSSCFFNSLSLLLALLVGRFVIQHPTNISKLACCRTSIQDRGNGVKE